VQAAVRQGYRDDSTFRLAALLATALPPFILGIVLLSIFYVGLYWFSLGRLGDAEMRVVNSPTFHSFTGLLTVDGLLNGRADISLSALRHLVLPVFTLSLSHWATLGRITRATAIEELDKVYILAARGRGISQRKVLWRHPLGNVLVPALNSSALSAASLVTGLFIIEVVFLYNGISSLFTQAMHISSLGATPDIPMALGFAIYSMIAVLVIMTLLDILQAALDPRLRAEGNLL
jgi:peptide/nickel transport system permease protein